MTLTPQQLREAIERAKRIIEEKKLSTKQTAIAEAIQAQAPIQKAPGAWEWNAEQQDAIQKTISKISCCLIGAAGTGKTTTLRGCLQQLLELNKLPPLEFGTTYLSTGAPGIVLVSYTRRAVRNIAKQMLPELRGHCLTIHKLLEFAPEYYTDVNENGEEVNKMRFSPSRHRYNPLPYGLKTIVVDESSMVSLDLFEQLLDALPDVSSVQFIFLGDLNQLPPVYGQAILGLKLLELPIVELTTIYRQALESPIISLATAIRTNNFKALEVELNSTGTFSRSTDAPINFTKITEKQSFWKEGRGKVTLHPWKKTLHQEDALEAMCGQLAVWIDEKVYDPEEDLVLCPWNKSFGTDELNKAIATKLGRDRAAIVHEVIAGYQKHYLAVGDKLLLDKQDAIILEIDKNRRYLGKHPLPPSMTMDRWGNDASAPSLLDDRLSDLEIDELLTAYSEIEDRTAEASHTIKVRMLDSGEEVYISKSAVYNATTFGYAITVHKAQGSECRKVFFLTHSCHAAMCSRELVYTAVTRAAEELYIVMPPSMLSNSAGKPRIKGETLKDKLAFFESRFNERVES